MTQDSASGENMIVMMVPACQAVGFVSDEPLACSRGFQQLA